jgi:hypothetical protein
MMQSINELVAGNAQRVAVDRLRCWGAIAGGCLAVTAAVYARHPLSQAVLGAGALGAGVYAQAIDRRVRLGGQLMESTDRIAMEAIARAYQQALSPAQLQQAIALPAATQAIEPFDWGLFNTAPDTYAHLAIVGPTGSGKSTLAEILCTMLGGITIAIAPHRKPGDFAALGDRVYAGGRNIGSKGDSAADFDELLAGNAGKVSAVAAVKAIAVEMERRYQLYDQGADCGALVNVIWDETIACLDSVPELTQPLLQLLREARKVRLRLIVLPQDDAVKSLKIEGQGAARANLTYVRLGKVAIAHSKALSPDVAAWVASQGRPCLVEDQPAIVPSVGALPPGPVPAAIAPAQHQDDRQLLARCWDSAIEVGHETIARDVELPPAALAIQQWIGERKDTFKLRDFQRAGIGELKGLNADSILAFLQILEAAGVGLLWNDGQGWRFRLI